MRPRHLAGVLCLSVAVTAAAALPAAAAAVPAATADSAETTALLDPAVARTGPVLRVVTFNVFQDLDAGRHRHDWKRLRTHADVVLLHETARFRVSDMVRSRGWKVFQAAGDRGESAVVVRRAAVRSAGRPLVRRMVSAHDCAGAAIGPRFLVSARLVLRNGSHLRVASTHLPHAGCSDAGSHRITPHLRSWVLTPRLRLVIGADWNRRVRSDPGGLGASTRLRPRGVGIDGFQVDRRIRLRGTARLGHDADWDSDHEPVRVVLRPRAAG